MSAPLYLDNGTTAAAAPEVIDAMARALRDGLGSPSSPHSAGLAAREIVDTARGHCARLLGALPEEIVFTSGETEAANLALFGAAQALRKKGNHLVIGATEHPSICHIALELERHHGFELTWIPPDAEGRIAPESIVTALRPETVLAVIQHSSPEIGTLQPIAEISKKVHAAGALLFCDGSGSVGWTGVDIHALGIDLLSVAPHRFFGPKGVGALFVRRGVTLEPQIVGGRQENDLRAGLENVPGIAGAGVAAELALRDLAVRSETCRSRLAPFESRLLATLAPARRNGPALEERLPHLLSLSIGHIESEALLLLLDLQGIQIGGLTGCVTKDHPLLPPVLRAIGLSEPLARGTITLGIDPSVSEQDLGRATASILRCVEKIRGMSQSWKEVSA